MDDRAEFLVLPTAGVRPVPAFSDEQQALDEASHCANSRGGGYAVYRRVAIVSKRIVVDRLDTRPPLDLGTSSR